MKFGNMFLFFIVLTAILLSSGCISTTGTDVTSIAKSLPAVKEFLTEYPGAVITVALWDNETVKANIESIQSECGRQMQVGDYYRVTITDPSLSLVIWLRKSNYEMLCAVRQPTHIAKENEKGNVVEREEKTNQSTRKEYCGNYICESGEDSSNCPKDCYTAEARCGNGVCESSEHLFSCPQDCGYELYPYESDEKSCITKEGKEIPTTGKGYANWFVDGKCGHKKIYEVNTGSPIALYVYTDKCENCNCIHPNFHVFEYNGREWVKTEYFDLPDEKGISKAIEYVPKYYQIKIYSNECFYIKVYSKSPLNPRPLKSCQDSDGGREYYIKGTATEFYEVSAVPMQATAISTQETAAVASPIRVNAITGNVVYAESVSSQKAVAIAVPIVSSAEISRVYSETDLCLDNRTLKEFYCDGPNISYEFYSCPLGCRDGACMKEECKYLYWFDDNSRECGYKQFCGFYMYYGLRTFASREECYIALNATTTTTLQNWFCNDTDWFGSGDYQHLQRLMTKGVCADNYGVNEDKCLDSNRLVDYTCEPLMQEPKRCGYTTYYCTSYGFAGCSNGACFNYTNSTTTSSTTTIGCSSYPDGACPSYCSMGVDYDCCANYGYYWLQTPWGYGCYNSTYNPGCGAGQQCSSSSDGCCPNWCSAGSDADCCSQQGKCWSGTSCYTCYNTTTTFSTNTTINQTILADLIVEDIYYGGGVYLYVRYCNNGGDSDQKFLIKLTNLQTGVHYDGNVYYPFSVPARGTCSTTGGYTPGLIGLNYSQPAIVSAEIDWQNTVAESNEYNNVLNKTI